MFLPKVPMKLPRLHLPKLSLPSLTPGAANLLLFVGGLLLLGIGLSLWYFPAGLVGMGVVMLYVAVFGGEPQG